MCSMAKERQFWKVMQEIQWLKNLIYRFWCRRHSSNILSNVRYIKVFTKHRVYFPVWLFDHHSLGVLLGEKKQTRNYAPGIKHLHPKAQGHILVLWKRKCFAYFDTLIFTHHVSPCFWDGPNITTAISLCANTDFWGGLPGIVLLLDVLSKFSIAPVLKQHSSAVFLHTYQHSNRNCVMRRPHSIVQNEDPVSDCLTEE